MRDFRIDQPWRDWFGVENLPATVPGTASDLYAKNVLNLVKLFVDRQLRVGEDVVSFLLARMERSLDAAQRIVAALDAAALTGRRNITIPLARRVLDDIEETHKGT